VTGRSSDGGCGREHLNPRFDDDEDAERDRLARIERIEIEADLRRAAESVEREN
jgi:hypothetical protein